MPETYMSVHVQALGVGTAVRDCARHSQEQVAIDRMRLVEMHNASQSTHGIVRQNSVASTPATR